MPQPIANVYTRDGRNMRVLTTPGRSVQFIGGHAVVFDHRDMPTLLQTTGLLVQPTPEAMSWSNDWFKHIREIKADVTWPEGWSVNFVSENEFSVTGPAAGIAEYVSLAQKTTTEPVRTVDMTPHPSSGWINPADLLSGPEESNNDRNAGNGSDTAESARAGASAPASRPARATRSGKSRSRRAAAV